VKYKPNSRYFWSVACDYANGRRIVRCCSHIAAIVYYLAHARYLSTFKSSSEILSKMFQQDDITPVIEENSNED